jgi:hypothetical protein
MSMAVAFLGKGHIVPQLLICIFFYIETSNGNAFMTVHQVGAWEIFSLFLWKGWQREGKGGLDCTSNM